jgi:uncharacterized membrane protein YeaQ/YmgE (transglycosylase-associated protein family)
MNLIAWVGLGSLLGALASAMLKVVSVRDVLMNFSAGSVGAVGSGWILSREGLAVFPQANFSRVATAVMMGFAVGLLIVFNFVLRIAREPGRQRRLSAVARLPQDSP